MRSSKSCAVRSTSSDFLQSPSVHPSPVSSSDTAPAAGANAVIDLDDASFAAVVHGTPGALLVDVWAAWCGPCRLMAPLMDWAASTYAGALAVGKLEADPNPATRATLNIQGLPTLVLYRDGEEVARHEGALAKPQLQAFLDAHL